MVRRQAAIASKKAKASLFWLLYQAITAPRAATNDVVSGWPMTEAAFISGRALLGSRLTFKARTLSVWLTKLTILFCDSYGTGHVGVDLAVIFEGADLGIGEAVYRTGR